MEKKDLCSGVGAAGELIGEGQVACPGCKQTFGTHARGPMLVASVPVHLNIRERVGVEESDGEDRAEAELGAGLDEKTFGFSTNPLAHHGDDDFPY